MLCPVWRDGITPEQRKKQVSDPVTSHFVSRAWRTDGAAGADPTAAASRVIGSACEASFRDTRGELGLAMVPMCGLGSIRD